MTLAVVRQRKLRTGEVTFSSTTASTVENYLVVVNERASKEQVASLFIAYTPAGGPPNPIPKATLKQFQSGFLLCDSISVQTVAEKTSLIWAVAVNWKEPEVSEPPQLQSAPAPTIDTSGATPVVSEPDDWSPTWSRRGHVVFVEKDQIKLFYKGGYTGGIHAALNAAPLDRHLFQASNQLPFKNPPPLRKMLHVWNFRWIRATIPQNLVNAEGKLNSVAFTIRRGGRNFVLAPHTALIDSLELSSYKYKGANYTEISVEILQNPDGFYIEYLDQGTMVRTGTTPDSNRVPYKPIQDDTARVVYTPQKLNGSGGVDPAPAEVYGTWSDYEEVDFADVDLIKTLRP